MTRNQLIQSLKKCSEAESDRICTRLQTCNVRIVKNDGSKTLNYELRTRLQVAALMESNPDIARVEYNFNGKWRTACTV